MLSLIGQPIITHYQFKIAMNQSESFNQLTLPTLEYENKKMSLFGDVCETQFHYADFTEIGNYRTENTLNGEIEIYLDVQPLFDPNYNPLYVSNWKNTAHAILLC